MEDNLFFKKCLDNDCFATLYRVEWLIRITAFATVKRCDSTNYIY